MRKKILIVLSVIFLIALIIGTMYLIDMKRMKDKKPIVFSTWGYDYAPPVDPENQTIERKKISEANLKADDVDVTILVRFNDILYGKSYAIIDYAGDLNNYIGMIDFVIEKEYVPLLNGETNQEELLNSKVLEANEKSLVLNYNNEAILFGAIIEN